MNGTWYVILLILTQIVLWLIVSKIPRLKYRKGLFLALSFVSIWIFLTIRASYSDMMVYEKFFYSIGPDKFGVAMERDWETLFKFLVYVIRLITDDVRVLWGIVAIITLSGPFFFIKRYSKNYLLTVIMFITIGSFYMQFYIIRQAIAVSIFLMAFHFITDKKPLKYCLSIVIAAFFHQTALVLLLLYPLINIPDSRVKKRIVGVITTLGLVFSPLISSTMVSILYKEYTNGISGAGVRLLLFYLAMYCIYLILSWDRRKDEKEEIRKTALFTIFWQVFATQHNIFNRLANYTRDAFCILIPNAVCGFDNRKRKIFSVSIIVVCICFVLVSGLFSWYNVL